jgi:integrase
MDGSAGQSAHDRPLAVASRAAGLPEGTNNLKLPKGASLHTLRRTHGSHLLAAGVPLTDVSKRLAHALAGRDDLVATAWEKFQKDAGRSKEPRAPCKAKPCKEIG